MPGLRRERHLRADADGGHSLGAADVVGIFIEAVRNLALADGAQLLVLDNAEHLIESVAAWAHRLGQALPGLALLVTSQLPLRIASEALIPLEPLPVPPASSVAATSLIAANRPALLSLIVNRVA